ncbi:diguanylate cyclase [Sulfurimonas sp.]|uniref:diguanylate cyclase n=1 Tax=Sulfurimonas sp. TaxID=2022749 RepID=UPI00356662F0
MMEFPKVSDISTKDVLCIKDSQTIQEAIELMYENNHRDIVIRIENKQEFGLLKVNDVIRLKLQDIDFSQQIKTIKYDIVASVNDNDSVLDCLKEIDSVNNCLCAVDDEYNLTGFVSYYDIVSSIDPQMMLEKRPVSEILLTTHIKQAFVVTPAAEVARMMDSILYDCVIVDEEESPVGIVTTKDVMQMLGNNEDLNKPISEYMSTPLQTVRYDTSIKDALDFIQKKHFKRLIVENYDGKIIGQITQEEIVAKVYSKWAENMRDNDAELREINKLLAARAMKYEELSTIDNLTGIFNRSKFEMELRNEIKRIERYTTDTFSLVFLDIDHFKSINDKYGHLEGDNTLRDMARLIEKNLRSTDTLARWGGEEFVIIMPLTPMELAREVTEKFRKIIEQEQFYVVGSVTCSFGISEFKKGDNAQSIILRADQAMYKAKANGRNRVEAV